MALQWKKDPKPKGLERVAAGPRGSTLWINGSIRVATVRTYGFLSGKTGWFWVAGWGNPDIPHKNTCNAPSTTEEEAKAAALAYVRKCLKQPTKGKDQK
ncbi:MAG: hypothetical protein ACKO0Z_25030 [Betaproteobacteria bacterium]